MLYVMFFDLSVFLALKWMYTDEHKCQKQYLLEHVYLRTLQHMQSHNLSRYICKVLKYMLYRFALSFINYTYVP